MNRNQNIVCIGLPTWEGEYAKSTVQVMSRMARTHEVLYVDYQYTVKDLVAGLMVEHFRRRNRPPFMS
jgi:hypothetical protein